MHPAGGLIVTIRGQGARCLTIGMHRQLTHPEPVSASVYTSFACTFTMTTSTLKGSTPFSQVPVLEPKLVAIQPSGKIKPQVQQYSYYNIHVQPMERTPAGGTRMGLRDPTTKNLLGWFCASPHHLATTWSVTPQIQAERLHVQQQNHERVLAKRVESDPFKTSSLLHPNRLARSPV